MHNYLMMEDENKFNKVISYAEKLVGSNNVTVNIPLIPGKVDPSAVIDADRDQWNKICDYRDNLR